MNLYEKAYTTALSRTEDKELLSTWPAYVAAAKEGIDRIDGTPGKKIYRKLKRYVPRHVIYTINLKLRRI